MKLHIDPRLGLGHGDPDQAANQAAAEAAAVAAYRARVHRESARTRIHEEAQRRIAAVLAAHQEALREGATLDEADAAARPQIEEIVDDKVAALAALDQPAQAVTA